MEERGLYPVSADASASLRCSLSAPILTEDARSWGENIYLSLVKSSGNKNSPQRVKKLMALLSTKQETSLSGDGSAHRWPVSPANSDQKTNECKTQSRGQTPRGSFSGTRLKGGQPHSPMSAPPFQDPCLREAAKRKDLDDVTEAANAETGDPAWPCEPSKAQNRSWLQLEGERRKEERFEM